MSKRSSSIERVFQSIYQGAQRIVFYSLACKHDVSEEEGKESSSELDDSMYSEVMRRRRRAGLSFDEAKR